MMKKDFVTQTDSFITHKIFILKFGKRFNFSNYEADQPIAFGKNKKVFGMMKDELGGIIMMEFVCLRPKMYLCLTDDDKEEKIQRVKRNASINVD